MATKTYTAQEMREEAKCFELSGGSGAIPAMLRQAADALEREEKREKKYEYSFKYKVNGVVSTFARGCSCSFAISEAKRHNGVAVRREVGEWDEVRDGE